MESAERVRRSPSISAAMWLKKTGRGGTSAAAMGSV